MSLQVEIVNYFNSRAYSEPHINTDTDTDTDTDTEYTT
jgi:hypothetical protein